MIYKISQIFQHQVCAAGIIVDMERQTYIKKRRYLLAAHNSLSDVRDGVVKGVQFRNHEIIGDIVPPLARAKEGADELVFLILQHLLMVVVDRAYGVSLK